MATPAGVAYLLGGVAVKVTFPLKLQGKPLFLVLPELSMAAHFCVAILLEGIDLVDLCGRSLCGSDGGGGATGLESTVVVWWCFLGFGGGAFGAAGRPSVSPS